ncbi:hypothetical protein ACT7DJ_12665 [Bacillus cereus]
MRNLYNNYPYIQVGAKAHYDPLTALKGALMETLASLNLLANPNQDIAEIVDIKKYKKYKKVSRIICSITHQGMIKMLLIS